ncbi:hypothetical protein AB0H45_35100 [Streptomyces atroolivaceus]
MRDEYWADMTNEDWEAIDSAELAEFNARMDAEEAAAAERDQH